MSGQDLFYEGTWIMKNKLGIRSQDELDLVERKLTTLRSFELPEVTRDMGYGFDRLQAIHGIFRDLYDWAGKKRDIEIKKFSNDQNFASPDEIDDVFAEVQVELMDQGWFEEGRDIDPITFCKTMASVYNQVNFAHPFVEGNGRAIRVYIQDLAAEAGYNLDFDRTNKSQWYAASKQAFEGNSQLLERIIHNISTPYSMGVGVEVSGEDMQKDTRFLKDMYGLDIGSEVVESQFGKNQDDYFISKLREQTSNKVEKSPGSPNPFQ